ncbi:MAG TPA: Calx-beta domain-containing protein [Thermoanaerobaculia bacterium]|jgi:uncharacterized repeat protein (TIGR01451 family)
MARFGRLAVLCFTAGTFGVFGQTGTVANGGAQPAVSIGDVSQSEEMTGTTGFVFEVTLSTPSQQTIEVDFTTADDSATAPDDYAAISGTVTFDPGETAQTVTVEVVGDTTFEPTETFFVNLSDPVNTTIDDGQGTGTIVNTDEEPLIAIGDVTLEEGDSGTTDFVFDVTLTNASHETVTVDFSTFVDPTSTPAVSPDDYGAVSGTLTFAPGEMSKTITVEVVGDELIEQNQFFSVRLRNAVNGGISDDEGIGAILNDDGELTVSIGDVTQAEGNNYSSAFLFPVTLSGPTDQQVTVNFFTEGGTADLGDDYEFENFSVFFAPGETEQHVGITVYGGLVLEPDETFNVRLTSATDGVTITDNLATGTILNDDVAPTVSIGNASAVEGSAPGQNELSFQVTMSHPSEQPVTVTWETADDTAVAPDDYVSSSGSVTFQPHDISPELTATITVPVNGDLIFEGGETLFVNLTSVTNNATIGDGQGVGTIRDDEGAPSVSITDVSQAEGDAGTTDFTFTVTLTQVSEDPVTVDFATEDGSAAAPGDYASTAGTLTFAPGDLSETITVAVVGDPTPEGDETFFVHLTEPSGGAAIGDGQGRGTIEDDEPVIAIGDASEPEGTSLVFVVTLSAARATPVTVDFATADGTAVAPGDYASASGTVTFEPGETQETITVTTVEDAGFEPDETLFVHLTNASGAAIGDTEGMGTLENDDGNPVLTIGDASAPEGTSVVFTLTLSAPSTEPVSVDFTTASVTAFPPSDYQQTTGTVTFMPGDTEETIAVPTVEDATFEGDETFQLILSDFTNVVVPDNHAVGTIEDDEGVPSISIGDVTAEEGNVSSVTFRFEVTLSHPSADDVRVEYATAPGTATADVDYFDDSFLLEFQAGTTSMPIEIIVLSDQVLEADETFFVRLSNPEGATIADDEGLGTILNDDALPVVSIGDVSQPENGTFVFTVTRTGQLETEETVDFATSNGTAVAPSDYEAASGTLVLTPGNSSRTITITVVDDDLFEPDETFFVNLSNPSGVVIADDRGEGTIENDDGPVADLSLTKLGPESVDPGEPITYTITVSNAGPQAATNVVVEDTIPAGTTFVSATPSQGSCSGTAVVTCNLGTIGDDSSATITLIVTAPLVNGPISNTATADSDETDPTVAAGTAPTFVNGAVSNAAGIPTLSEWALLLMLMGMAAAAATRLRG